MGGRVALWCALEHPERVEGLMLVGASAAAPEGEMRRRFELLRELALDEGVEAALDSEGMQATLPREYIDGASAEEFRRRFLKNTPEDYAAAVDAILGTPDMRERLGEIHIPAWACMGEGTPGRWHTGRCSRNEYPIA